MDKYKLKRIEQSIEEAKDEARNKEILEEQKNQDELNDRLDHN